MAEYDDGVLANEILLSQEIQRERNFGGRRATRTRVIRLVAAALVLDIAAAGRTMAEPLRHQHGEAACDQKRDQRAVFRLRHLRPTQHILRRGMCDHRKPERTGADGAKQQRMRGNVGIRRWHAPLLPAKRLALLTR
ncbi:hypothetical protein J2R73_010853 [Bradyrhizobium japonicum]|nr:hypothetical protein [Bradyrhizobium japonicum]MCP1865849.1 hypothetical protein [Bradyrhizobium japonicum]MCP1962462.1 hypothetical protein [Bradyrhizobium japonicum]